MVSSRLAWATRGNLVSTEQESKHTEWTLKDPSGHSLGYHPVDFKLLPRGLESQATCPQGGLLSVSLVCSLEGTDEAVSSAPQTVVLCGPRSWWGL